MTEINTRASANSLQGMASGINTGAVIQKLISLEEKRAEPVKARADEVGVQLAAFGEVKKALEALNTNVQGLAENNMWEGKLVESSNPDVVTAIAAQGAKPGKHTLMVDKLALNHQIASQGYDDPGTVAGMGKFAITVGEEAPVTITIDESNNSLEGLKNAINNSGAEATASIIKTGNPNKPYQLVLTSKKTGEEGRIKLEIKMKNGEVPNFNNGVEPPSEWKGVDVKKAEKKPGEIPTNGASNSVIRVVGHYENKEDHTFTFTAVQTGTVGGENGLQLRWQDEDGRNGVIDLDAFNYAPGEAIPFQDGLSLVVSKGDLIVGDSFNFKARSRRSDAFWWMTETEKDSKYTQPTRWDRQKSFGAPEIGGTYTGEDEQEYTLTVTGSGQVGNGENLSIRWENESGESGILRVGRGYKPGSPLALSNGLTLSVNAGVMNEGDSSTFSATPEELSTKWWKNNEERHIPAEVIQPTPWASEAEKEEDEEFGITPDFPQEIKEKKSTSPVAVTGDFAGDKAKVYTFTALRDGAVGTTQDLKLRWEDDQGNSGELAVGESYTAGTPIPFDSGLSIAFGAGKVFDTDSFTLRTRSATIQPPQNALVRIGATEFGGGLEITSSTNEMDGVIEGLKLNLHSISDKPVTITIKGDTEKALASVKQFVELYNTYAGMVEELTKFDKDQSKAAPLLGDRDLANIKASLVNAVIEPVKGLPASSNMLMSLGIKITDKGLLKLDETVLSNKIGENFALVADLFRNKGESTHANISVVGISEDTKINTQGLPVEINQVATQGFYSSPVMVEPIHITERNNKLLINVNGRDSEAIELETGTKTLGELAKELQNKITNDKVVGGRRVRVMVDEGRLKIYSGSFGSNSSIAFKTAGENVEAPPGLTEGESIPGKDVEGTIGGEKAEGIGQVMKGRNDSDAIKGLRLFVTLTESQLMEKQPESMVTITKGIASRVGQYLASVVDPVKGDMKRIFDGLNTQKKTYVEQLKTLTQRMERKRVSLQEKFAKMEGQMQHLKSQQNYMAGQIGSLPSAAANLPGL